MPSRRAIKARITKSALKARQAKAEARAGDMLISKARLLGLDVQFTEGGNIYLYGGIYLWASKGEFRKALRQFDKEVEQADRAGYVKLGARDTLIAKARLLGINVEVTDGYLTFFPPAGMRFVFNKSESLWAWSGQFRAALELFDQGIERKGDW